MTSKNGVPVFKPFNPLDKQNLGESVADALLATPIQNLPPEPFIGAGVYALYYTGTYPTYELLASLNTDDFCYPIYVGKAVPAGARKGGLGNDTDQGQVLYKRLYEHSQSIESVQNLNLNDFHCRFLVVDDIWIPLAESMLIDKFKPVWNHVIDGFGNHDPGNGRYNGKMPPWDCVHPGREWASRLQPCIYSKEQLDRKVYDYLRIITSGLKG